MDLESTLETIATYAEGLSSAIDAVSSRLPEGLDLKGALSAAVDAIPAEVDFLSTMQFLLLFAAGSLILSLLGRAVLGKRSSLNHSVSSAMGILCIYVVTIVVYTCKPWNLAEFLSPLPFVTFLDNHIMLLPFTKAEIPILCHEILSLVILAFLVNLLDTFIPQGESILGWYALRFLTVVLSMALHLVVNWAFNTYLPDVLVTYAPVILLGLLLGMLLLGVLNVILGLVLTVVNPFIGAVYTFFFSNIVGKQLTKAVFSTALICAVIFLLEYFGYTVICITTGALVSYIPFIAVLAILWYLIGHVL